MAKNTDKSVSMCERCSGKKMKRDREREREREREKQGGIGRHTEQT